MDGATKAGVGAAAIGVESLLPIFNVNVLDKSMARAGMTVLVRGRNAVRAIVSSRVVEVWFCIGGIEYNGDEGTR